MMDADRLLAKRLQAREQEELTDEEKARLKGRNGYYEIMRADGSAKTYLLFSQLLKEFDREDMENVWKLVKEKHVNTRPEEGYERVLWGDLKTMFEHHINYEVWKCGPYNQDPIALND
ncbi:hypothetical protein Tco_1428892 [Tanacetum coccineum]